MTDFSSWQAVGLATEAWRVMWHHQFGLTRADELAEPGVCDVNPVNSDRLGTLLTARIPWLTDSGLSGFLGDCERRNLIEDARGSWRLRHPYTCLLEWLQSLFGADLNGSDLRHIAATNVRVRYGISLDVRYVRVFQSWGTTLRQCFMNQPPGGVQAGTLLAALLYNAGTDEQWARNAGFGFLETALLTGVLRPSVEDEQSLTLHSSSRDPNSLLHVLFGLHTSIPGFDGLFEGGLRLAETPGMDESVQGQGGRVIVIRGRFGAGKSTVALLLGSEVARKGGFVWYYPIEEDPQQCRHALGCLTARDAQGLYEVVETPALAVKRLASRQEARRVDPTWRAGKGLFVFHTARNTTYDSLLNPLDSACRDLDRFREPLTLMVVDPLNAVLRADEDAEAASRTRLRANAVEILMGARRNGANVMLVCEEETETAADIQFIENIADTVIRLTIESRKDYRQRFVEVAKSRYQKEVGGKHAFTIEQGSGIRIFPSSAAIALRSENRQVCVRRSPDYFGFDDLDTLLGKGAFYRGDSLVVTGPPESLRSPLAATFLVSTLQTTRDSRVVDQALLLTARDDIQTATDTLSRLVRQQQGNQVTPEEAAEVVRKGIRVCTLPTGYVLPGSVFQQLDREFDEADRDGCSISRVVLDDVSLLELVCPLIREDENFGAALLEYLASRNATALIVSSVPDAKHGTSRLGSVIASAAHVAIQLNLYEYRGIARTGLRVTRTRTMRHRRETFELVLSDEGLKIAAGPELLRPGAGGTMMPIGVRFFLHAENDMQARYNARLVASTGAVLTSETSCEAIDGVVMRGSSLSAVGSAVDEVQVVQLDEFQARTAGQGASGQAIELHAFPQSDWVRNEEWRDTLEAFTVTSGDSFRVVPFYANVGCLVLRRDLDLPEGLTWSDLAELCCSEKAGPVFDFPRGTTENYNCLFFEILLSLANGPPAACEGMCPLREWLSGEPALNAGRLFRTLCRPTAAVSACEQIEGRGGGILKVDHGAHIWRHWYSTLRQMLNEMPAEKRSELEVRPLPGGRAVAGEWYLGIPSSSSAPDVGLEIIRTLTTREAELLRLRQGVGLPTKRGFYESREGCGIGQEVIAGFAPTRISGNFDRAFRRSSLPCYSAVTAALAYRLRALIEAPADERAVADALTAFGEDLVFMGFEGVNGEGFHGRCRAYCGRRT